MTNIQQKIKSFDWNHVEEVSEDEIHLIDQNQIFSPWIEISKEEVLNQHHPESLLVGMQRSGWDSHRDIHRTFDPADLWEEDKYEMVQNAWNQITRVWKNADGETLKIETPC